MGTIMAMVKLDRKLSELTRCFNHCANIFLVCSLMQMVSRPTSKYDESPSFVPASCSILLLLLPYEVQIHNGIAHYKT